MISVQQFVPSYTARSAIGSHATEVTRALQSMGVPTQTWVGEARGVPAGSVRPYESYQGPAAGETALLLYQLSIGSPMADFLAARPEPLAVNYHNITPAACFQPWEPLVVPELVQGRRQLAALAGRSSGAIAVSRYNEIELLDAGYRHTAVCPVLIDLEEFASTSDPATDRSLAAAKVAGGADWLFVGRLSPNKCQHHLIRALAVYRRLYDPRARLRLVGGSSSHLYLTTLQRYAAALGLADAVDFAGSVPQEVLTSYWRQADVFVCLSEHEGFCIPLLEAMWHRVPIVALATSAVPETLAGAGLLLGPGAGGADPVTVAAAVARISSDSDLRAALIASGRQRVAGFSLERTRAQFCRTMEGLLAEVADAGGRGCGPGPGGRA